jgi:hypothetical protein
VKLDKHAGVVFGVLLSLVTLFSSCSSSGSSEALFQSNDLKNSNQRSCRLKTLVQQPDLLLEELRTSPYFCLDRDLYQNELIELLYSASLFQIVLNHLEGTPSNAVLERHNYLTLLSYFLYFDSSIEKYQIDSEQKKQFLDTVMKFVSDDQIFDQVPDRDLLVYQRYEFILIWAIDLSWTEDFRIEALEFLVDKVDKGLSDYCRWRAARAIARNVYDSLLYAKHPESSVYYSGVNERFLSWYLSLFNHPLKPIRLDVVFYSGAFAYASEAVSGIVLQHLVTREVLDLAVKGTASQLDSVGVRGWEPGLYDQSYQERVEIDDFDLSRIDWDIGDLPEVKDFPDFMVA